MERGIFIIAFFFICFHLGGLATTNILRLTFGAKLPVLSSKCHCDHCGAAITPFYQLPVISYIVCKGKCRNCGIRIPKFGLMLEIIVMVGMFITLVCFDFSVLGVTLSFIYYEVIRFLVVMKHGKREMDFKKQYVIAVLAMVPFYAMTAFVALLYGVVCKG
ncbi:MAG: prepilin peptidase [Lachnospiraceae bacterium]|nr:prepilin peptidase [Lachnospiraceae bacterium]